MRRSCRLSTRQEHKLLKKAEAAAATAAAAEAAVERVFACPSSVTRAIAGLLATPMLPSPSMSPDDWRMVEELLHDGQGHETEPQSLCITKLFANLDTEPGACTDDQRIGARLPCAGPETSSAPYTEDQAGLVQMGPDFPLVEGSQAPFTFSQLLTHPEAEPGSATSSQGAFASGLADQVSLGVSEEALPQLSSSLPEDGLDCEGLDAIMWAELEDLGMDAGSHPDIASLGVLDMSQTSAAGQLHASTLMVSAMPSHTMQLPMPTSSCILPPSTTTHFIPVDAAHPTTTPTFLPPPHLASQQSADSSSCTIIVTQHQQHTHFPMQHASLPLSNLSLSAGPDVAAAESAALQHQSSCASEEPAKKKAPGRRKRAAKSAAVAPVPGCDSAQGMAERPVRRKRGPYKKRVKGEAKVKAPKVKAPSGRKRKAISLLPAVQAFRLQGMQMQASAPDHPLACLPTADQPGPSKRARLDMPLPTPAGLLASSEGSVPGSRHAATMDVDALAQYFPGPSSDQQAAAPCQAQPDKPIIAAPRDFLKAAMRAREAHQPLQAAAPPEGEGQQQPIQAIVQQPGCLAPEAPTLDMKAGSQGTSLLLDASTLHGMLQQTPLDSHQVLEPEQQVPTSLPASLPGKAGRRGPSTCRRKQSRPTSAAAAAASSPAACLAPTATGEAQLRSGLEQQPLAPPAEPDALPTQPAAGASLPSVAPVETADTGKLCHKSSSLASVCSRSLKAEILARLESVLSSSLVPATATAVSSGRDVGSAGTAQAAPACEGVNSSAGEMRSEMKGRLRALLQGGGLQELAALLFSEDSEVGSDVSDESGSLSGNGTSGNGSGDGVARNNEQASSYVEQDQVVGPSKAAEVQLSCGMRTKNGGGHQHQPAEESQKKKGNKHITMLYLEQGGYFDVPIHIAAQQLSVGVTTLKKICRTASVYRWPFRKRTSIERLIERTEHFMPLVADDAELQQHMEALQALLERKDDFKHACQRLDLHADLKAFRQSVFKKVYKEHKDPQEKQKAAKAGRAGPSLAAGKGRSTVKQ